MKASWIQVSSLEFKVEAEKLLDIGIQSGNSINISKLAWCKSEILVKILSSSVGAVLNFKQRG